MEMNDAVIDEKDEKIDKVDKVDKVDLEDLIKGLKINEEKSLKLYLTDIWKVSN